MAWAATSEGAGLAGPPRQAVLPQQKAQSWQGHQGGQGRTGDAGTAASQLCLPHPSMPSFATGTTGCSSSSCRVLGLAPRSSNVIRTINFQLVTWSSKEHGRRGGPKRGCAQCGLAQCGGQRGPPHWVACCSLVRRLCSLSVTATWHRREKG